MGLKDVILEYVIKLVSDLRPRFIKFSGNYLSRCSQWVNVRVIGFNATFNNISVISWQSYNIM
jgi:hypothetical protein